MSVTAAPILARSTWRTALPGAVGMVIVGSSVAVSQALTTAPLLTAQAARLTGTDWAAMAYLAIIVTAVAFLLWYTTVAALGPARVGLLTGIAPISAAVTGIIVGGRTPRPLEWAGMLVVIAGLGLGLGLASDGAA